MQQYKNLILLGTSHIAKESIAEVSYYFKQYDPNIVALELDKLRFDNLISKKRKVKLRNLENIGTKGIIFGIIVNWIEKELGKVVNVKPGSEMLTAIKLVKENKRQIILIDQDIRITLRRISQTLSWKEKWHFIADLIKAFGSNKKIGIDLTKVPEQKIISNLNKKLKQRYPNVYQTLVIERNIFMANNLKQIMNRNKDKKILAIIGAGHEKEILELIKNE